MGRVARASCPWLVRTNQCIATTTWAGRPCHAIPRAGRPCHPTRFSGSNIQTNKQAWFRAPRGLGSWRGDSVDGHGEGGLGAVTVVGGDAGGLEVVQALAGGSGGGVDGGGIGGGGEGLAGHVVDLLDAAFEGDVEGEVLFYRAGGGVGVFSHNGDEVGDAVGFAEDDGDDALGVGHFGKGGRGGGGVGGEDFGVEEFGEEGGGVAFGEEGEEVLLFEGRGAGACGGGREAGVGGVVEAPAERQRAERLKG